MIVKREFYNVECDHCGQLLNEETWWDDKDALSGILDECGWKELGGKHYDIGAGKPTVSTVG